ncbi:putative phage-related membrane protein [Cupriavidus taiwanensis]|uniref:Putative phage-related membrane protein n=1 Tax=Cupriavidus taiwanensis TaxID=164546 RepID=A0A375IE58_9BURK|nr:hypothetical protein [Cupriavidus taiwanensis]SPK73066.1 putative phage-related membrane protein [Cupriavidus taiwanensis]
MSIKQFDLLASLYARVEFEPNRREGTLAIGDAATLQALQTVVAEEEEYALHLPEDDPESVKIGDTVAVEAGTPRTGIGFFTASFADLIRNPTARVAEPSGYFLIAEKFNSRSGEPAPDIVQRYRKLLDLIKLLGEAAAFLDHSLGRLVYIHDGKFEVPVQYTAAEVAALDVNVVEGLVSAIGVDTHREQKLAILAEAVRELTEATPPSARFVTLLAHLPDLAKKFSDGYRLFASSFSYEKVKSELEAARVDYAAKIHKVFTDIQNQILGIPVATVVVATQMKAATTVDANFYINVAVLIGAWIFVILVAALLLNQTHTLDVLKEEIERQKKGLEKLHKDVASNFSSVFHFLNCRLAVQRWLLRGVLAILFGGGILATVTFFFITDPARAALARFTGH